MNELTCLLFAIALLAYGIAGQYTLDRVIRLEKRVKELEEDRNASK